MSSNEDRLHLELQKTTIGAINAYCRVLELHIKAVEQGADPRLKGKVGEAVTTATEGLKREVEFLSFLRSAAGVTGGETDSPDEPSSRS